MNEWLRSSDIQLNKFKEEKDEMNDGQNETRTTTLWCQIKNLPVFIW